MPAKCCKDRWERLLNEDPEMPVFTLLAKDALAIKTVEFWLAEAQKAGVNHDKIAKVQGHLDALVDYANKHPKEMHVPD